MSLNTGMKMIKTETVTVENAAKTLGSGSLLVYGTPAMLLLVEKTAVALLDGHLDEGMTTVGTNLNVDHVSASPIGCEVSCEVTLTEIDRKKLVFAVEVNTRDSLWMQRSSRIKRMESLINNGGDRKE